MWRQDSSANSSIPQGRPANLVLINSWIVLFTSVVLGYLFFERDNAATMASEMSRDILGGTAGHGSRPVRGYEGARKIHPFRREYLAPMNLPKTTASHFPLELPFGFHWFRFNVRK